tara:strand:- start:531 stop:833 length:303 start_codon:yes stop_codon:yes gene_type:complete
MCLALPLPCADPLSGLSQPSQNRFHERFCLDQPGDAEVAFQGCRYRAGTSHIPFGAGFDTFVRDTSLAADLDPHKNTVSAQLVKFGLSDTSQHVSGGSAI